MNSKVGGALVVAIVLGGAGGMFAFQVARDFHHTTVGAWFPDDTQVVLVRPLHLPFNQDRAMDLWWVSLKDGKVTKQAREQVGAMQELSYIGVAQQRLWFVSTPSDTIVNRGARATNDRYDVKPKLAAHPTLSARFDVAGFSPEGLFIKDQRAQHYRVLSDGTFREEDWSMLPMRGVYEQHDWRYPDLRTHSHPGPPSIDKLPYVRAGVLFDPAGQPIRPREGGWLIVGEELQKGADPEVKHVVVRVDDRGTAQWQLPLMKSFTDTAVDDFSFGDWYSARLVAMHTTPQRVWVVCEISVHEGGEHETRIVEIDAASGKVLRSMVPHL